MSRLQPAKVTAPFVALVVVTGAMHVVSRTTGSGWLVVVVSFLLSVIALSIVLPAWALTHAEVRVAAPADATARRPVTLTVTSSTRGRCIMRLTVPRSDWLLVEETASGPVAAVPARRGVVRHVDVEVRSAAPFGLVWCRRRVRVPLERPLEVGPVPHDVAAPPLVGDEVDSTAGAPRPSVLAPELPRGVRDYVVGDPPRLVSWVATARHGRLMVREMEGEPASARLTLVVDLRGPEALAEEIASRAAGLAAAALRTGNEVVLSTAETGGPVLGPVTSNVEIGRRLARATRERPPADAPAGALVVKGGRS